MYMELKESAITNGTEVMKRYPGMAYLLVDAHQPFVNGITLETQGRLYAIADKSGVDELYGTAKTFRDNGVCVLVDNFPLYDSELAFFGFDSEVL